VNKKIGYEVLKINANVWSDIDEFLKKKNKNLFKNYPFDRLSFKYRWARAWTNAPLENSNEAKGIITSGIDKFYLITFIGSGLNAVGGMAVIKEDLNSNQNCTQSINFTSNSFSPFVYSINPYYSDYYDQLYLLSLSAYEPNFNTTSTCSITSVSNCESIKNCDFVITSKNGYLKFMI
jgi:hypothetical protein